jgi:hypothetical protein
MTTFLDEAQVELVVLDILGELGLGVDPYGLAGKFQGLSGVLAQCDPEDTARRTRPTSGKSSSD